MRKNIVAGNWKMNKSLEEGKTLISEIMNTQNSSDCQIIIIPPFIHLSVANEITCNSNIAIGAQDCSANQSGAYTGEVSAQMIKSAGCQYVIVGHSERRAMHNESNNLLNIKVNQALENKLTPIYCCGETLEEREANRHFEVVKQQIQEGLFTLTEEQIKNSIIAYEPVWAIGTGKTASADQAQEIHNYIRTIIADKYGNSVAQEISILYGGSVKPQNAQEIFAKEDVDGGLIGGASLKAEDFIAITKGF
jgi:triosephosphate isomerase